MLELTVKYLDASYDLQFEHSLRSVSKWESKYRKPYLSRFEHTPLEQLDYFACMLLTPGVDPDIVCMVTPEQMQELNDYITTPQTASTVPESTDKGAPETVTSELMYHWITAMKISWEVQDWHLSRFIMLVKIHGFKMKPPEKKDPKALAASWAEANERQKALFKTKG